MAYAQTKSKTEDDHGGLVDLDVRWNPKACMHVANFQDDETARRMGFVPRELVYVLSYPDPKPKDYKLEPGRWRCTPLRIRDGKHHRTHVRALEKV